jgi:hypothetical protein
VSDQLHAPAVLSPWKIPRYPLDRRLGGHQSRSGRFGEEKILDPTGIRTPTYKYKYYGRKRNIRRHKSRHGDQASISVGLQSTKYFVVRNVMMTIMIVMMMMMMMMMMMIIIIIIIIIIITTNSVVLVH